MTAPLPDLAVLPGGPTHLTAVTDADIEAFRVELGRPPRGALAVAHRCDHNIPAVVLTAPKLPDGTPFPTLYYLCCSTLNAAVSRMESEGLMRQFQDELGEDEELAAAYRFAHDTYLATRNAVDDMGIAVTAGGMPDRVKCLHVLVAHSLAAGPGVNPVGDKAIALLSEHWRSGKPCVQLPDGDTTPAL